MLPILYAKHPKISIHAPRTGSDDISHKKKGRHPIFQSTLPARGATAFTPTTTGPLL